MPKSRLTWTATNGTLSDDALETDGKGEGRAVFTAQEPGDGTVEVVVNVAGYEEAKAQTTVGVVAPVETSKPAAKLAGIPVLYAFLVIAAGVLVYIGGRIYWRNNGI